MKRIARRLFTAECLQLDVIPNQDVIEWHK